MQEGEEPAQQNEAIEQVRWEDEDLDHPNIYAEDDNEENRGAMKVEEDKKKPEEEVPLLYYSCALRDFVKYFPSTELMKWWDPDAQTFYEWTTDRVESGFLEQELEKVVKERKEQQAEERKREQRAKGEQSDEEIGEADNVSEKKKRRRNGL